ncbi:hypothetical protein MTsPCn5_00590 [Croceitalea sp. MTPC5]|uniref:helix-turn-helix transcriptional regulator n=1 Tax=Croceitalea sp. MTPC5 TaxID=3056565 RepID=UPI002B3E97A0|nr:hypothetical protein MTsPCn5_00590 [Croceitalea sp. MTPC5]
METRRRRAYEELERLSFNLKGEIVKANETFSLHIGSTSGHGEVKCVNFDDGLFMLEFELNVTEDTYIPLVTKNDNSVYFLYCMKGDCYYAAQRNNHFVRLNELQTAIVKISDNFAGGIVLKGQSDITLNVLRVDIETYFEKHAKNPTYIAERLKTFLDELNHTHNLVHLGKLNFDIADYIKKLEKVKNVDTLSELLYFEGICILILASHIEQYKREISGKINPTKLIKRELKVIMDTAEYIQENLEKQITVQALTLQSGLSAAKLQEGFKFLYQRTVSDFIRNVRLEKAQVLMRETDMNISEIVYSIGLTSRSYFCKIFKEKYGCNPKSFKSKTNQTSIV